jgi:hypothetical protein
MLQFSKRVPGAWFLVLGFKASSSRVRAGFLISESSEVRSLLPQASRLMPFPPPDYCLLLLSLIGFEEDVPTVGVVEMVPEAAEFADHGLGLGLAPEEPDQLDLFAPGAGEALG